MGNHDNNIVSNRITISPANRRVNENTWTQELTILLSLKEVSCSRIIADCGCVFRSFSAPSMTVCDLSGHWIVSADTVGCEPEPDPIAIAVRLEPVLLLEQARRNTEQRESTLNS